MNDWEERLGEEDFEERNEISLKEEAEKFLENYPFLLREGDLLNVYGLIRVALFYGKPIKKGFFKYIIFRNYSIEERTLSFR